MQIDRVIKPAAASEDAARLLEVLEGDLARLRQLLEVIQGLAATRPQGAAAALEQIEALAGLAAPRLAQLGQMVTAVPG